MTTDSEVWSRVLAGDAAALGVIYDRHHARVYRHSLSILRNVNEAEDATATVFFELWRRRTKVRDVEGSVLPWLLATATNVCRNAARSTRRYRALLDSLPRSLAASSAEQMSLDQAAALDDLDDDLAQELRRLPARTAELLTLTAIEGYSIAEASRVVGMSEGAARTRLSRAKSSIRASRALVATSPEAMEESS
jgi:RNA polymerase sigma-70 factor (ECF subfamily)